MRFKLQGFICTESSETLKKSVFHWTFTFLRARYIIYPDVWAQILICGNIFLIISADTINGFRNAQKSRHVFTISLSDRPLLTFQWLMIRCNFITVGKAELLNIEMQIIYDWITFKHSSGSLLNYSYTFDVWLVT